MNKILIIGGGIIGGSIIKKLNSNNNYQLFFYDTNVNTVKEIESNYKCKYSNNFNDFEHIILCVPIKYIFTYLDMFSDLNTKATIYDCSSTKHEIEQYALTKKLNYIGLHPMCGSEKNGFKYSDENLFTNKTIICTKHTEFTTRLVEDLNGNLKIIESEIHDKLTAQISHVPQLISLLINQVDDEAKEIAGNGFKDMTRISASSYTVWEDILKTNKSNIMLELKKLNTNLIAMITQLENEDFETLSTWFNNK